jgi:DNA-binding response OmpR family regulator
MPKLRVLIIEDEPDLLALYAYHLKRLGYRVFSAGTAKSGLLAAGKRRLDLIILDLVLPDMDGQECYRIIRKESRVPILFLTARKTAADRALSRACPATDYLAKPCSITALARQVRTMTSRGFADEA